MLHGSTHIVLLDATHISGCGLAGHHGVFRVVLEVAAVEGMAVNVEGGSQVNIGPIFVYFLSHGFTYAFHQFLVPGAGKEGSDGEVGAVVRVRVVLTGGVDAQTGRAVGEDDGGNAQAGDGVGGACGAGNDVLSGAHYGGVSVTSGHTHANDKMYFLFQGHGLEDFVHGRLAQLGVAALASGKGQDGGRNQDGFFHKIFLVNSCAINFTNIGVIHGKRRKRRTFRQNR